MYKTIKHTKQFDFSDSRHKDEYDAILNNPLCTVLEKIKEKLRDSEQVGESNITTERLVFLVTWQEKKLC